MLEGEPSWLAVFGRAAEPFGQFDEAPLCLASARSGYALQIQLGDGPYPPAVAQRENAAAILDGVLLDRRPLKAALGPQALKGTEGDAGLLLTAYLELGERALPLLRGSLGLLIWDGRNDMLLCARDPTDSHPLFFSRAGDLVLISASHGALLGAGRVPAELDRLAIARWVVYGSTLPERTFYSRIQRLPPGHVLTATPEGVRVRRYWHPGNGAELAGLTPEKAVNRLEELLDQAVTRSASLGPLGVFLSGGVDSAVVAGSAARVSRMASLPNPVALSYAYPDPDASEENTQRSVANELDIPIRLVPLFDTVGPEGLLVAALDVTQRSWMPCVNPWEPGFLRLAEQGAALGCRVILSGEGGNDWFEAQRYEAADLIRHFELVRLWRLWSQERRAGRSALRTARGLLWTYGGRPLLRDVALDALRMLGEPALIGTIHRRRIAAPIRTAWALPDTGLRTALVDELVERRWSGRPPSYRDSANERKLGGMHLVVPMENRFLFSRKAGVHFFNPAVDPDLVSFLYGLSSTLLNLGDRGKGLAWESVRRSTGGTVAGLLGFADLENFFAALMRTETPRALRELGGLRRLSELGIVNEPDFARALNGPRLGAELSYYQAWQALACEAWLR
jgi:hypothetical protein